MKSQIKLLERKDLNKFEIFQPQIGKNVYFRKDKISQSGNNSSPLSFPTIIRWCNYLTIYVSPFLSINFS